MFLDKAFGSYIYVKPFVDLAKRFGIRAHYFKLTAPLSVLIKRVENRRNFSLEEKIEIGEWPLPSGDKLTARAIYEFCERNRHEEGIEIETEKNSPDKVVEIILSYLLI